MSKYAYVNSNNSIAQISNLGKYNIDTYILDQCYKDIFVVPYTNIKKRTALANIPAWRQLMDVLVPGDVIYTSSLTNLGLDLIKIIKILEELDKKNIRLIAFEEDFDSFSDEAHALFFVLPLMEKFRQNVAAAKRNRQQAGIQRASEEGKLAGRQAYSIEDFPDFRELYSLYMQRELTKGDFAQRLGVSRPTLDRLLDEFLTPKRRD